MLQPQFSLGIPDVVYTCHAETSAFLYGKDKNYCYTYKYVV